MANAWQDAINASEYTWEQFTKEQDTPLPEIQPQDLSGKVVIVTGANVGIGFETAKSIASMKPQKLILACRNAEKAQAAVDSIKSSTNFHDIEAWSLDLASFASTQAFAKKFLDSGLPLDILVSNAGLGVSPTWTESDDGHEITTQVNHLANVLLIGLLHPALKKAKRDPKAHFPRVNVVSSDTHFWAGYPQPDDPHPVHTLLKKPEGQPSQLGVYPSTKLMNVLFAKGYAARCPDSIWICATNPGYTQSELGQKDPKSGAATGVHRNPIATIRSTYEGAKTIIHASISPNVGESGGYYSSMKESRSRSSTVGETGKKFADAVWNDTVEILKKHVPNVEIYSW
eukprot:Phypoly_transcript_11929.p1 GENE.Phypoly_transcript_11929~~Phypoly_transcript_11929.p1  ORF type:complete len:385 (+),score=63.88 Phypoly_transcript_11929:127-1155(+)